MAKPRIIYVEPGEMIEFRFVDEEQGFFKNATDWRAQSHAGSILARLWHRRITVADGMTNFDRNFTDDKH